jgi:tripartite-type tricarboxylate transporter receptor subunit TctC
MKQIYYALFAGACIALAGALPAGAQDHAAFYKSKNLRIMLGHPPGGSYDLYARLAAEFLPRYLPGSPTIIVEHKPGGGGVVATAWFYAQAPRDGSMISLFPETIAHTQILEPDVGKWKVQEMTYIGSFAPVNAAFVVRKGAPASNPAEMKQKANTVGCTGVNSQSYQLPAMMKALSGFQFNMVCGYKGGADALLALIRGEVDMVSSAWNSLRAGHKGELERGEMIPVIQAGLRRLPELKDVPLMQEVVDDPKTKKLFEFASAGSAIGRALLAPPQVPAERIAVLREAFDKMVKDPDFLAAAEKRSAEIDPTPGAEVQKYADGILNTPADLVAAATKAMGG